MGGIGSGGHNQIFCDEVADEVINLHTQGMALKEICAKVGIHLTTLVDWRKDNPHFDSKFACASLIAAECLADELIAIPDTYEDVTRGRLKSDNIKWLLARRAASKYGDRVGIDITSTVNVGGALEEALRRALPQSDTTNKPQPIDIVIESAPSTSGTAPSDPIESDIFD